MRNYVMLFLSNLAFGLGIIALALGMAFLIWSYRTQALGVILARITGVVITLLSLLFILHTYYYGIRYSISQSNSATNTRVHISKKPIMQRPEIQQQIQEPKNQIQQEPEIKRTIPRAQPV
jgi:predicted membrane protein